jgi:predicted DNA-binding transcriptional regulator AlpA
VQPVGTVEVAHLLGVTRQRVAQLASEDPTFPRPIATLATGRLWDRDAIVRWAKKVGRSIQDPKAS